MAINTPERKIDYSHLPQGENRYLLVRNENGQFDQKYAGTVLKQAVIRFKDPLVSYPEKLLIQEALLPEVLEDIAVTSATDRWDRENVESALTAYTELQTLEQKWGEESHHTYRRIARNVVRSGVANKYLDKTALEVSKEGRGAVINLSSEGAQTAQTIVQEALRDTCDEFNAGAVIAPYYRDMALTTNWDYDDPSKDPNGDLMTIEETFAELARTRDAIRGGKELPVKAKINKKNKITVFPGTPNVGGHVATATGFAEAKRIEAMNRRGQKFDSPQRANAFHEKQTRNDDVVLLSTGDGAGSFQEEVFKLQNNGRLPIIDLFQNNELAIGTENIEVSAQNQMWKLGHGHDIPGIRVEQNEFDKLYLATRFAAIRAILDSGPTIIEAMTVRLVPHSNQHGDHITATIIRNVEQVLEKAKTTGTPRDLIDQLAKTLYRPSQSDTQPALRKRLRSVTNQGRQAFNPEITLELESIASRITDPAEQLENHLKEKQVITDEDLTNWQQEAEDTISKVYDKTMAKPRPEPEDAIKFIAPPNPKIIRDFSSETRRMNMSEALRTVRKEAMADNPNIRNFGTDTYKGPAVHGDTILEEGGYFGQSRGLFENFADQPRRETNMPIAETPVMGFLLGMSTTPTDPESIAKAHRTIYDPQYADYGVEGIRALKVAASLFYTMEGKLARPMITLLHAGAVGGGGTSHSHEVASTFNQTPYGVDLVYAINAEQAYKRLNWYLRYGQRPVAFMTDRSQMFANMEFTQGTGVIEPGRANQIRNGNLQFISYGPMSNTIDKALQAFETDYGPTDTGIFDVGSLRPFPTDDLISYLEGKNGPIIVAHQEPAGDYSNNPELEVIGQGFGAQIVDLLTQHPKFAEIVRKRKILHIGGKPVPAPPCDGILMNAVIPNVEEMQKVIKKHLPINAAPFRLFMEEK